MFWIVLVPFGASSANPRFDSGGCAHLFGRLERAIRAVTKRMVEFPIECGSSRAAGWLQS